MNRKKNRRSETDPAAKGPSLRNYFLIAAFFLTAVALSTLFIRNTYRNLYYENVKNESGSLRAYADQQFMSYNSINWLVEYWRTTDMSQVWKTMSFDKWERLKNSFGKTIQDITPEDIADMTPEKQALFAEICYVTFVDSFEYFMIYLHVDSLYFEQYNSDTNEVTVILAHNANQSLLDIPGKLRTVQNPEPHIYGNGELWSDGEGMLDMTRKWSDGKMRDYLRYIERISIWNEIEYYVSWEDDWSDVAKEINRGALKISVITVTMFLVICLGVMYMYRKYATERMRAGVEQERVRAEIDICSKIQLSQLPDPAEEFRSCGGIDAGVLIRPAKEVGGDFCDCFLIGGQKAGLVIADVSDKGLSAAMFMMLAKSMIRSEMKQGRTPGAVMERVNSQLAARNEAGMFVTVWLAEIDLETGECTAVNAGHENPVLRRAGGQWTLQKNPHDMPAGIAEGIGYTERKLQLYDGDMLFVYTDGVTDAVNAAGEHFGEERIPAALNAGSSSDAKAVIEGLSGVLSRYSEGAEQFDDIGMVCFRYQSRKTGNGENQL